MGTVDTRLMILPDPRRVYDQASKQIIAGRDSPNGFILGTACETPPYTLPGNIQAMVRAAQDHGTYGKW
jgi:uroporphyrinogen decarboxylase